MSSQANPFFDLGKVVHQASIEHYTADFHAIKVANHDVVVGMARRARNNARQEMLLTSALRENEKWGNEEAKQITEYSMKKQFARGEEWILSRFIEKHGIPLFHGYFGIIKSPCISISHSIDMVVVAFSDATVGIDHETVEARDASWHSKMDPANDAPRLAAFLSRWKDILMPTTETILWAMKEATMKAWGERDLGLLPAITTQGSKDSIRSVIPGQQSGQRCCWNLVQLDVHGVLAIAFKDDKM
jgi:hypothetical protein